MRRVGVQIGDDSLTWAEAGEVTRVAARVGALVRPTGEVGYLLAGDEAGADRHVVQWPRRSGYRWNDEATSGLVLQALLARVKQGLGPGAVPPLVIAVPYWVQRCGLVSAAQAVGWRDATLVTDLHALTWAAPPADLLLTMVPGSELLDVGVWVRKADGLVPLSFESWARLEVRERLASVLERPPVRAAAAGGDPLVVAGGDLVQAWADRGLDLEVEAAGARWLNLGPEAVAVAAATWTEARRMDLGGLHVFVEVGGDRPLELPRSGEAWRALTTGTGGRGRPVALRVTTGFADGPHATVLWEATVEPPSGPFLLHVVWVAGTVPAEAEVTVAAADGRELLRDRFALRSI
jgi:hypothetical protein